MKTYNHQEVEQKWQTIWQETGLYKTSDDLSKPKYYILDMFPYPSGVGLHVGHPKGYIATDILARVKMMQGFNVLHPMGWDAFGLPAENYALKNKVHPRVGTELNVANYKRQLSILGFSYDWDREINTTDSEYYKWTQWTFLKMFERGLVYESNEPINWCPSCKTGLANEDLEDGKCERCGSEIEQKPLRQWVIKITDYAERLLNDLDKLDGWENTIKDMQRHWIGRSEGAEIEFKIKNSEEKIKVFTTRVDTIFGCTYLVLAPEHKFVETQNLASQHASQQESLKKYLEEVKNKTDLQRTDLNKDKTGVKLEGVYAINPFNGEEVEIWVADYVLNSYGTGAVMAVAAHDERDWEFAHKYNLKVKTSIKNKNNNLENICFTEDGVLVDSGEFTGLTSSEARTKMIDWLEKNKIGTRKINYKLKDWVFSRQRYWGEPIPIIHCETCGAVGVPEAELPVVLPEVEHYEPSGTGESPLATIPEWVNTTCPKCGGPAKRETNTMPQWAGSSWYYLRYMDPKNSQALVDIDKEKYWAPVDFYVGGAEHATRHLIYARFWHKFLADIGVVSTQEPFKKLQHVGLIMGEDGRKMSKRWGNVINPDEIAEKYGADSLRVYEMFMSPFDQACAWNTNGLSGARKFLERIWNLQEKLVTETDDKKILNLLHKTIKKVSEDILDFKYNTAISAMMILINAITEAGKLNRQSYELLITILAPFAPHFTEEIWRNLGYKDSIFKNAWPSYNSELIVDETYNLVIQINGKVRATLEVAADITEEAVWELIMSNQKVQEYLTDKEIVKKIFVPGRLVSLAIK